MLGRAGVDTNTFKAHLGRVSLIGYNFFNGNGNGTPLNCLTLAVGVQVEPTSSKQAGKSIGPQYQQGLSVMPSGLFPSVLKRPWGSKRDGTCAAKSVRWIMSLMAE